MRHAEQVTFGGAGFDRATDLRSDTAEIARLQAEKGAKTIVFWRGKPLVNSDTMELVWLPLSHKVLLDAQSDPVFLGLAKGVACFATEIPKWQAEGQEPPLGFWDDSQQKHPALPDHQVFTDLRMVMARLSPTDAELAAMSVGVFSWHRTHGFCAKCGQKTAMSLAGWQRQCPVCEALHFPRTDPVVIMLVTRGNSLLLGRSPQWPEGMYSLLAGFMEPGETVEAAVRREVFEETQVLVSQVDYLCSQPWPFPSSLMIGCAAKAISSEITIDPKEIEDAKWVTREELLALWAEPGPVNMTARKGSIANFLIKNWLSDTINCR